jgi:hypothetical protein
VALAASLFNSQSILSQYHTAGRSCNGPYSGASQVLHRRPHQARADSADDGHESEEGNGLRGGGGGGGGQAVEATYY